MLPPESRPAMPKVNPAVVLAAAAAAGVALFVAAFLPSPAAAAPAPVASVCRTQQLAVRADPGLVRR
jgi:hypothetical protein